MKKLTKAVCRTLLRRVMSLKGTRQVLLTDDGQHATMFAGDHTEICFDMIHSVKGAPMIAMEVRPVDVPEWQQDSAMCLFFNSETMELEEVIR